MKRLTFVLIFALSVSSVAHSSVETSSSNEPNLQEVMEEMGEHFKQVRRSLAKEDMGPETQSQCQALSDSLYVSVPLGIQIIDMTPEDLIVYKKLMAEALALSYRLHELVQLQDLERAVEATKTLNAKRKEAHDLFK